MLDNHQQSVESKSIWDVHDTMPIVSELTSPSIHGSQIYPQYPSENRPLQQFRQAWIVEGPQENETKITQKATNGPEKKNILTLIAVGTLIGLFICGIPLAVMTTLYLEQKSQATSSTISPGSSETSTATSSSLPSQCTSYTTNTDSTRNAGYTSGCCWCDSVITAGWYRFSGAAGTQLITSPVNVNSCGTDYPGWFNGSLPTTAGATTSGFVCVNYIGYICYIPYSITSVLATNCSSFYVFYLTPMTTCPTRYCTT